MIKNLQNQSQDILQERVKRDPAIGSSVLPTVLFLGLATLLLP